MLDQVEIAHALKDKNYFHSLRPAEQEAVVTAGGIGAVDISDESLESVSSGLEGGSQMLYTGTDAQEEGGSQTMIICTC
ncbi:hypothetical protein [Nocardia goodfellowii]|uniref:Uncharacterized protein n=1 Tax=Nocardia goodfellowii TaxID=882446 RepID=A0ABS4QHS9_9NOCA|nr:hypothetical protein [Nocardia goodfellowii]MBP2191128.1 hypothetical protein [Nocardia goodfellowii]